LEILFGRKSYRKQLKKWSVRVSKLHSIKKGTSLFYE
jgi:hypothetical protein